MRQRINLSERIKTFRRQLEEQGIADKEEVAICDIARDPLKSFAEVTTGYVACFRTNNAHLWVLPSLPLVGKLGDLGRLMTVAEKARCAGLVPESLASLRTHDSEVAIGNTIPVPLIGAIMLPVLKAWHEARLDA